MFKEDFVSFEQAQKLKAFGCPQSIDYPFHDLWYLKDGNVANISPIADDSYRTEVSCKCVTLSQACKWLRSKGWAVQVYLNGVRGNYYSEVWQIGFSGFVSEPSKLFDTYEQAQSVGIDVALGLLEKTKKQ